jgi:hypothetical protein
MINYSAQQQIVYKTSAAHFALQCHASLHTEATERAGGTWPAKHMTMTMQSSGMGSFFQHNANVSTWQRHHDSKWALQQMSRMTETIAQTVPRLNAPAKRLLRLLLIKQRPGNQRPKVLQPNRSSPCMHAYCALIVFFQVQLIATCMHQ